MNEDDKELLILDLCARQPHGIRAYCKDGDCDVNVHFISDAQQPPECTAVVITDDLLDFETDVDNLIPYLRPVSDMRDNEREEFAKIREVVEARFMNASSKDGFTLAFTELDDFLNKHHFDYRGMIAKGLARPCIYEMYFK